MAFRNDTQSRVRITETDRVLHIVIPTRRCGFTVALASFFLLCWAMVGIAFFAGLVLGQFEVRHALRAVSALLFWAVWGIFPWLMLLWNLRGREIVVIEGTALWIRWAIGKRGYTREFTLAHVTNLRCESPLALWDVNRWLRPALRIRYGSGRGACWGGGCIAFDYGTGKTYRFGQAINPAEAQQIKTAIECRLSPSR